MKYIIDILLQYFSENKNNRHTINRDIITINAKPIIFFAFLFSFFFISFIILSILPVSSWGFDASIKNSLNNNYNNYENPLKITVLSGNIKLPNDKITVEGNNIPVRPLIIGICHAFHLNYVLSGEVGGTVTLHIKKIPLPQALSIILKADNLGYSENNGVIFIGKNASLANNYIDYKINLKYIQAKNILPVLTPILPAGAKAYASPHGNSLFVYDIPSNIDKIKQIIKNLDVKKRVVLLNAKLVDITDNFTRNVGVNWTFLGNAESAILPNVNNTSSNFATDFSGVTDLSSGANYLNLGVLAPWQNFGNISAQLSLGQQLGWDKIIDSPSVTVISGQQATINSSLMEYYVAYTTSGGTTTSTGSSSSTSSSAPAGGTTVIAQEPVTSTLQTITIGITLTVTPIVESNNNILLNVNVTYSSPAGGGIDGFPSVNNKSVSTVVEVKNNSTLVIGGLLSTEKSRSNDGIPILSEIPVLGYLFGYHQRSVDTEQLTVFISPKILN
ncbi:MAG: secretin N-terminal domain-containing protein [Candidatus Acidulodesulfobacterium sp.]